MTNAIQTLSFSELIRALSFALDLTEGQPMGHAVRSCALGMRIADEIGIDSEGKRDLYHALLLKDAGCSSNASKLFHVLAGDEIRAKREVKTTDWTRVGWDSLQYALRNVRAGCPAWDRIWGLVSVAARQKRTSWELVKLRCERGASVARKINLSERTAQAIYSLDEHWNGKGQPDGLRGEEIPIFSRIMNLAQTLDVFRIERGESAALEAAHNRSGRWFDPAMVKAAESLHKRGCLFPEAECRALKTEVEICESYDREIEMSEDTLDSVCEAFAEIIDAKSPYTYLHSTGVAEAAVGIAQSLGLDASTVRTVRRAALLHDIGKLSVPNTILEKPVKLTAAEWGVVKNHPYYTMEILRRVRGFAEISEIAASHHEKLDGSGYFRHMDAATLSLPSRILVVADIYDALSANRPYRESLDQDTVLKTMRKDAPKALDSDCVEALAGVTQAAGWCSVHESSRETSAAIAA
jgi:putative nucleotidyltransferase with HDIG domain